MQRTVVVTLGGDHRPANECRRGDYWGRHSVFSTVSDRNGGAHTDRIAANADPRANADCYPVANPVSHAERQAGVRRRLLRRLCLG